MQKNQHFARDVLQFWQFRHIVKQVGRHKVPRLPRNTTWQPAWKHSKRRGFAASPIDTAKRQENQRLETRRVGAPQLAFRARRPPIFTRDETGGSTKTSISYETSSYILALCSFKIDVFLRVFLRTWKFATSKSISTCHKMPRLPRNLHLVTTWRSPANAIYKKHATGHV